MSKKPKGVALTVEEDPKTGELFVSFPTDWMTKKGWRPDDRLHWSVDPVDGRTKVVNLSEFARSQPADNDQLPLFIVETVVMHRVRYAVRAEDAIHASDAVVCKEDGLQEFDQNCIDESIFSVRQVTLEEYLASFDLPSDPRLKLRYIHTIDYKPKT